MKLTPEIKYIQEKCVLASHPGLSLEEAKIKEIYLGNCDLVISYNMGTGRDPDTFTEMVDSYDMNGDEIFFSCDDRFSSISMEEFIEYIVEGINDGINYDDGENMVVLPSPSLSRVLNGLSQYHYYFNGKIQGPKNLGPKFPFNICDWKLLNDDGSDATLFDQSPKTISSIAKEMGYK